MAEEEKNKDSKPHENGLAFATTSTIYCLVTDPISDVLITTVLTNQYMKRVHHVTASAVNNVGFWSRFKNIYKGELLGDIAAIPVMMVAEKLLPGPIHAVEKAVGTVLNPIYNIVGPWALKTWAKEHGTKPGEERFDGKLEQWKAEQSKNIVRSVIMGATSVLGSWLYFKHKANRGEGEQLGGVAVPLKILAAGKVLGAIATYSSVVGMRAAFPRASRKVDKGFNKVVDKITGIFSRNKESAQEEKKVPETLETSKPVKQEIPEQEARKPFEFKTQPPLSFVEKTLRTSDAEFLSR